MIVRGVSFVGPENLERLQTDQTDLRKKMDYLIIEMGKLTTEITKTQTIIRNYNGLREMVQDHESILKQYQTEVLERRQNKTDFKRTLPVWGALTVAVASFWHSFFH